MFIDLHTHALFGVDDGASDSSVSFDMLESAHKQGVYKVVLSPHCILRDEESIDEFIAKRQEQYDILLNESVLLNKKIPELCLGAEVYLDNDISKFDGIKQLCIQGTNLMLIELPEGKISRRFVEWIYNLTLLDIQPLLAHIERYRISKEVFAELIDLDVNYQINANIFNSLKGRRNLKKILKTTRWLCVASDMHNNNNRCCNLLDSYKIASVKFPQIAEDLFKNNPKKLFKDYSKV